MDGNGKVFISHAHADNERCRSLLTALDAWGIDYWFDTQQMRGGDRLSDRIERAIAERDVFIRVCTPAAQESYWVDLETDAFRGLQADEHRRGLRDERRLINLILDAGYRIRPFDRAMVSINAAGQSESAWLSELRRALDLMTLSPIAAAQTQTAPPTASELDLFGSAYSRRLPVYFVIGTSATMAGVKIREINNGLESIRQEMLADPRSASTVCLSRITFAHSAYQFPLQPIDMFTPPTLTAFEPDCSLGAALRVLNQSLDDDLIPNSPGRKGDYKPLVFLTMDRSPTDRWQHEAQRLKSRSNNQPLNTIGLAIGPDADIGIMKQICKVVMQMQNVTPDQLRSFFDWVSGSVITNSQA